MSALTNAQRKTRTEGRITELLAFCSKSKYRWEIMDHFSVHWGVGETTISHVVQDALREGSLEYFGKYKAVK